MDETEGLKEKMAQLSVFHGFLQFWEEMTIDELTREVDQHLLLL